MTARSRRGSPRRGGSSKRGSYWDGLQLPSTAVTGTGPVAVLIDTTAQEFMPATLDRIRGHMWFQNGGASADLGAVTVYAKILYVEVNDAQTMTGDHSALDTHEEDIAVRQLWTYTTQLPRFLGTDGEETGNEVVRLELDVKSKLRLEPSGKKLLVAIFEASANSRANVGMYLRCHLMHG